MAVPVVFFTGGTAHAQDSAADVEAEIEEAWRELEPIIEEHNATRIELKERKREADKLADKMKPLEKEVDQARDEISEIAAYNFKTGNVSAINALLSTGSPFTVADQLAALDQFAKSQRDAIAGVLETKAEYETEQEELDELIDELTTMEDDLAERADEIEADIEEFEERYDELVGSETPANTGETTSSSGDCPVSNPGGAAGTAVTFACAQVGKAYGYGSAGPDSFDCSGLTSVAWEQAGVSLPHNAAQQRDAIPSVERSNLRPGDLIFYYSDLSHVAMYIGGNSIVQASNPSKPVNVAPMDQMPIHSYGRPG